MPTVSHADLLKLGQEIFERCGATSDEASVIINELVMSSLLGVDSHGISSIPQYVREVERGIVRPGAPLSVIQDRGSVLVYDCGFNFGISQAMKVVAVLAERTTHHGIACAVGERSHHIGRLGTYVQYLALKGLIGLGYACGSTKFSRNGVVAPFGGREGKLSTNPIAYAVPRSEGSILFDVTTAAIPQQKLKILHRSGQSAPDLTIMDRDGADTQDPAAVLNGGGSILPFGGHQAHKGYGLALLAEILAGYLSGNLYADSQSVDGQYSNSFAFIGIDPEGFCGTGVFSGLMDEFGAYIKSSAPRSEQLPVMLPGELEQRTYNERIQNGIPVNAVEWEHLLETAKKLGVSWKTPSGSAAPPPEDT